MKCILCKKAETAPGVTDVTLERDGFRLLVKNAPAQICPGTNLPQLRRSLRR